MTGHNFYVNSGYRVILKIYTDGATNRSSSPLHTSSQTTFCFCEKLECLSVFIFLFILISIPAAPQFYYVIITYKEYSSWVIGLENIPHTKRAKKGSNTAPYLQARGKAGRRGGEAAAARRDRAQRKTVFYKLTLHEQ